MTDMEKLRKAVESLVTYLEDTEQKDFLDFVQDGNDPKNHIYYDILVVEHLMFERQTPAEALLTMLSEC